ncbi:hypothetical protein RAS1_09480 [Phycisphaerae bacterium RAS1]|nr:hypothetical protein RAS1_09480 [Phycisphaerae bacterium RAS1]
MARPLGFSTGSLTAGDFRSALAVLDSTSATAVELSALRESELPALLDALPGLSLTKFGHVSFHAPSALSSYREAELAQLLLERVASRGIAVVVHADIITNADYWKPLKRWLLVENMDKRKSAGRTASELRPILSACAQARLCVDLAHARQVDPTLLETTLILREFARRVGQLHVSELSTQSRHEPLSFAACAALRAVATLIPPDVPAILEFKSDTHEIDSHLKLVSNTLSPALQLIRSAG